MRVSLRIEANLQRSRVQTVLVLVIGFVAAVYVFSSGGLRYSAPAFSLPEVDGGQVDLASYSGRPVLLVFWTTSCPICRHELPVLDRLEPEFRGKGISVVTICVGGEDETRDYLSSNGISLKTLYDENGRVAHAYRVGGVPRLVLVDKAGKIRRSSSGWASENVLRHWMDAAS